MVGGMNIIDIFLGKIDWIYDWMERVGVEVTKGIGIWNVSILIGGMC